jgi:hypothetical protein
MLSTRTSDAMVIRVRRRLIAAARALADEGTVAPGWTSVAIATSSPSGRRAGHELPAGHGDPREIGHAE